MTTRRVSSVCKKSQISRRTRRTHKIQSTLFGAHSCRAGINRFLAKMDSVRRDDKRGEVVVREQERDTLESRMRGSVAASRYTISANEFWQCLRTSRACGWRGCRPNRSAKPISASLWLCLSVWNVVDAVWTPCRVVIVAQQTTSGRGGCEDTSCLGEYYLPNSSETGGHSQSYLTWMC